MAGNLTVGGNTQIGNATSDTLAITAALSSTVIFGTTNTYDIGSTTVLARALYSTAIVAGLGAVGTPSHTFNGDLDTGMWSSGANTLNFATNGSDRAILNSTGLGLGGVSPSTALHIERTGSPILWIKSTTDTVNNRPIVKVSSTNTDNANTLGEYQVTCEGTPGSEKRASIVGTILEAAATTNITSALVFYTTSANTISEKFRISSLGNIAVNTTLSAWDTAGGTKAIETVSGAWWHSAASTGLNNMAYYNGTNWIYKSSSIAPNDILMNGGAWTFRNAAVGTAGNAITYGTQFSIGATGLLTISGQVKFPATQNASTDVNTLDDYEEGSWIPAVGGTATYLVQDGKYTKIGNKVFIEGHLQINVLGTGSTSTITGLPFTSSALLTAAIHFGYFDNVSTNYVNISGVVQPSATTITFYGLTAAANTVSAITPSTNSSNYYFSGHYTV